MPCITTVMGRRQPHGTEVTFSTLRQGRTAAPPEMQTAGEVRWLDRYHARVAGSLALLLDPPPPLTGLQAATASIAAG
jgi:hypothetical protein